MEMRKRIDKKCVEWEQMGKGNEKKIALQFQLISIIMSLNFINLLFGGYKETEHYTMEIRGRMTKPKRKMKTQKDELF